MKNLRDGQILRFSHTKTCSVLIFQQKIVILLKKKGGKLVWLLFNESCLVLFSGQLLM